MFGKNDDEIKEEPKNVEQVIEEHKAKQAEIEQNRPTESVTTPLQEIQERQDKENRDKLAALSATLGIDKQNEEIDNLKKGQDLILQKLNEFAAVISQQSEAINAISQGGAIPTTGTNEVNQAEKLQALSSLLDSDVGKMLVNKFLGNNNQAPAPQPIISQEYINEKMKNSVMENFELGETILDSVKSQLKKKAVNNIVNTTLENTGLNQHEPR